MIRNHSHFSLLRGFGTPEKIVDKAKELGYGYCGLTDYKSISGCVDFYEKCIKEEIKPILGCDFDDFTLIAKNKEGWNELIEILSIDSPDFKHSDNLIRLNHVLGNHHESDITVLSVVPDKSSHSNDGVLSSVVCCPPSYYINTEDKEIHQILISIKLNKDIPHIQENIDNCFAICSKYYLEYSPFFLDKDFSMKEVHSDVDTIADMVEEFTILSKPRLPKFKCPNDLSEIEYLKELCRIGWKNKLSGVIGADKVEEYKDRMLRELDVIAKADLAGYFLIVQDLLRKVKEDNILLPTGRGSAAFSLIYALRSLTLRVNLP